MTINRGFTIAEIIIVISIMIMITISGMWVYNNMFERSQAAEIASDFKDIQSSWRLFLLDTNETSPLQGVYGTNNPDAPCHNEPIFFNTDLFTNVSGSSNWSGPYIKKEPSDPWGRRYSYDNNGDTYTFNTASPSYSIDKGVNAQLQWCDTNPEEQAKYTKLAPFVDKILDGGDGSSAGSFRWDPSPNGGYFFLLTAN